MPYGPANFWSTVVKPYYTEEALKDDNNPYNNLNDDYHNN